LNFPSWPSTCNCAELLLLAKISIMLPLITAESALTPLFVASLPINENWSVSRLSPPPVTENLL
jgi:hypothetical protein